MTQFKKIHSAARLERKKQYPVYVGAELLGQVGQLMTNLADFSWVDRTPHGVIIADQKVKLGALQLKKSLQQGKWQVDMILVRGGEGLKTLSSVNQIIGQLLGLGVSRNSVLFGLGGGSVGDVVGFLASILLRGIPWVSLPTTLLSQVDSSVGGKTGVNHKLGKNLVGSFCEPSLVICDSKILHSIGRRDRVSGLGEILKYGLVFDPRFLKFLRQHLTELLELEEKSIHYVVEQCLKRKIKVVAQDFRDEKGIREVLNFGHTFGHALEAHTNFRRFRHGEAVIWGMRFALALSRVRGLMDQAQCDSLDHFLASIKVPSLPGDFGVREFLLASKQDKKMKSGTLTFVLLAGVGRPLADRGVTQRDIGKALSVLRTRKAG